MLRILAVLLLIVSWPARGQASLEGDVYLVMKNGDVKPAASNTVYILPGSRLPTVVARVCQAGQGALTERLSKDLLARQRLADSAMSIWSALRNADPTVGLPSAETQALQAAYVATKDSVARFARDWPIISNRLLERAILESSFAAPTGMKAHYRWDGLTPGRYLLWAATTLYDVDYFWLSVVEMGASPQHRDLDNSLVREGKLRCQDLQDLTPPGR
jgi:hypothetical protein